MKYVGSKRLLAKHILPIMLKARCGATWVEPFVGGGNVIDKVPGPRIGGDANRYAIEALISIRDFLEDLPKNQYDFTESQYQGLKTSDAYPHKGYVGFAFSFGAKWLAGWRKPGRRRTEGSKPEDPIAGAYNSAKKQSAKLQGVVLHCGDYKTIPLPSQSIIYCDIPYKNHDLYRVPFDREAFWKWAREKALEGHRVFVSEYEAPSDFICVWEKQVKATMQESQDKQAVEKLFLAPGLLPQVKRAFYE